MSSQEILGLWIIGLFLLVVVGEAVAILILSYKLGVYKGRLARFELAEKQPAPQQSQP